MPACLRYMLGWLDRRDMSEEHEPDRSLSASMYMYGVLDQHLGVSGR